VTRDKYYISRQVPTVTRDSRINRNCTVLHPYSQALPEKGESLVRASIWLTFPVNRTPQNIPGLLLASSEIPHPVQDSTTHFSKYDSKFIYFPFWNFGLPKNT
jgi:hypothetical protein